MDRRTRAVNVTLLALFVIATFSGALAFTLDAAPLAPVVVMVHGASGLGLLVLVPAKARIIKRGLRRPGRSRKVISWTLSALVVGTIGGGLLHALRGFVPVLGLLPMQIHVGAALFATVLLIGHVLPYRHRRWPLVRRVDLDRRAGLKAAAVVAGALTLRTVAPGLPRRFTGSHEVAAAAMPVTQWLFDPVLRLDAAAWQLRLPGRTLDLAGLAVLPQTTVRAVIDCTGGWWAEQVWSGVRLADLDLSPSASVDVVSATGYRRRLPASDVATVLLATHAGGQPLADGHGGPVRLVVPGRRGFWWVKWVVAVEGTDEPWWLQPPLPLQ
jgi:DMSO/TMAO reductase YedYZ molybdopterin-dependent catalytic subunit